MPTPIFNFRLSTDRANSLREMAKVYGSKNTSEFLREMVGAMCSGETEQIKGFVGRLIQRAGEQLTLQLTAPLDAVSEPRKPAKTGRKGKRGGRHAGKRR